MLAKQRRGKQGVCIHICISYNTELIHIPLGQMTTTIIQ